MLDDSAVERVLCVMAHPDDVDFGLAGTVASWTDTGIEVSYCMITSGDAGGFDPSVPREAIAGIREREQTAAAKEVGVTDLRFLGYPDGQLEVSLGLRRDISRVIRQVRPQRVVCQSPERNWERIYGSHPDHLAAGEATMCAVYPDSRNPFTFVDTIGDLEAWTVNEVWISSAGKANHYVDITKQFERKKQALMRHESQIESAESLHNILHFWNGGNAQAAGLPEGSYAEAFWVMDVT
ncbi:MAG TPA: PIG-L deacetylase family protein, partial [Mycobacteriales bacterium]|nr:PIG-L deacetylase family protein [Mycobacteriales bacterium]